MSNKVTYTSTSPNGTVDTISSVKTYTHAIYLRDVVAHGEDAAWVLRAHTTREELAIKQANTFRNIIGYENVRIVPVSAR